MSQTNKYTFIEIVKEIMCKSWLISPIYIRNYFITRILRLKYSPLFLSKKLNSSLFSMILSTINIWWFYKTVNYNRHKLWDNEIIKLLANKKNDFCDFWCSDWSWSINLYLKYKKSFSNYDLYDKYTWIYYKSLFPWIIIFINQDWKIVYIQIFCILLYIFPLFNKTNIKLSNNYKFIKFDNPDIKKYNLEIKQADIFNNEIKKKYDIIKCANILNLEYLSITQIISFLEKLNNILKENWYIIIDHNNNKYNDNEAVLILKKINNKLIVYNNINNQELYPYLLDKI